MSTSAEVDQFNSLVKLLSDFAFAMPARKYAEETSHLVDRTFLYQFDETDKSENSLLKGYSWHAIDVPFTFYTNVVSGSDACTSYKQTADDVSETFIAFTYGQDPWERYGEGDNSPSLVFGGEKGRQIKYLQDKLQSRWKHWEVLYDNEKILNYVIRQGLRAMHHAGNLELV